jgi:hypothetical protein
MIAVRARWGSPDRLYALRWPPPIPWSPEGFDEIGGPMIAARVRHQVHTRALAVQMSPGGALCFPAQPPPGDSVRE